MGASPLMSLGVRALAANYAALQSTGHNIANANVAGYSRQSTVLSTSQGQYTGAGFFGRGVDVASVGRAHNAFLTRESANAQSLASMDAARLGQLQRLETVFKPGEGGLGAATSQLFDAMIDLSSRPSDLATRQVVLARANDLAARFNEAGSALDQAQQAVGADLRTTVADINRLAQAVAQANQRIASLKGSGQPPNDLLDQRDRLVAEISSKVQVTTIEADDGSVGLFVAGGQRLVLGVEAGQLQVVADTADPSRFAVAMREGSALRAIEPGSLGGGAIAGLLQYQNEDLVQGRNLVGQLAAAVGGALNEQQLRGISLQQPLGGAPSQPMFAVGEPLTRPQAGNAKDGDGIYIGGVVLTVTDSRALQASDYDLRESPSAPGTWQLTRLSDGKVTPVDSGDTVDGLRIDVFSAQPGDRFTLQPVGRAAKGMVSLLSSPLDIAAAAPLTATVGGGNAGTASVGEMLVTANPPPYPGDTETISFQRLNPPADGYDYTYTSSISGQSTPWRTGLPVIGANGFSLQMGGVPAEGDTIEVQPTLDGALATNNGNARALLALRDSALVAGRTATDAWSASLADIGVRVQSADTRASLSAAVAQGAEQSMSSQSGVNLDEEAARLIQFQQSYQAAAKVLQVAQSLFDTLLQVAGR